MDAGGVREGGGRLLDHHLEEDREGVEVGVAGAVVEGGGGVEALAKGVGPGVQQQPAALGVAFARGGADRRDSRGRRFVQGGPGCDQELHGRRVAPRGRRVEARVVPGLFPGGHKGEGGRKQQRQLRTATRGHGGSAGHRSCLS